jgi:hypothetical protein
MWNITHLCICLLLGDQRLLLLIRGLVGVYLCMETHTLRGGELPKGAFLPCDSVVLENKNYM